MAEGNFAPDAARAGEAAAALDHHLQQSFEHLAQACSARMTLDRCGIDRLAVRLAAGGVAHPAEYGIHFDLLDAIAAEDEPAILAGFRSLANVTIDDWIVPLDARALGDSLAALYRRVIDADDQRALALTAPPVGSVAAAGAQIAEGQALLRRIAPALAAEARHLTRQIVLATEAPDAAHPFYGGSSFFLWGGIFFNPQRHATAYETAETLVHEAAHTLLTALAREEPLVRNPRSARYQAPVRRDPRPMEGIYHATFVLSRTCLLHRTAAGATDLTQPVRTAAAAAARRDTHLFFDGFATVMAQAELGELGRALIEDAARFVSDGA